MSTYNKRYYWLKLPEDFFNRDDIKIIKSQKNGPAYLVFYLTLLTKSIENSGDLRFNELIPFNEEMLATITETDIDVVRTALKLFQQLGLLVIYDDNTLHMIETKNMIGSETASTRRSRKSRAKNQPKLSEKSPQMLQCNTNATNCNGDIDIELDKDKDKESNYKLYNNNKLVEKNNQSIDPISLSLVKKVGDDLKINENIYNKFFNYYKTRNFKTNDNILINSRNLKNFLILWNDREKQFNTKNNIPNEVEKPKWIDEYVEELKELE